MNHKFSVLMSLYGRENENNLKDALESLVNQTRKADQVVIVFDGPLTKQLESIVNSFNQHINDLTIVRLEYNVGLGQALNKGMAYCKYELVARMDTDDICYPNRFEKQLSYLLQNPSVSIVGSTIQEFDKEPKDLGIYRRLPLKLPEIKRFAKFRNPLNHPTVIFRKTDVLAAGSYMHMPLFEDFHLWIRVLERGLIIENIEEPLLHFRIGNDMVGRRHGYSYFQKEVNFLNSIKKIGFINNKQYLMSLAIKLPLRLMPKRLLKFLYKNLLR